MKTIFRITACILIFMQLVLFSGCWDYGEINNFALVSGFAIDKDKKTNQYCVTVEIINPTAKAQETDIRRALFSAKGDTIFQAIRNLIPVVSKRCYWAHAKVAVISQDIAREDIVAVIDLMDRDPELRSDINLLISREKTAKYILENQAKLEKLVSFELDDTIRSQSSIAEIPKGEVWHFVKDLTTGGIAPALPAVRIKQCGVNLYSPEVLGSAFFKGKNMIDWLDGKETRGMLWLRNNVKQTVVVLENVNKQKAKISMELFRSKTSIKPEYENGKLSMNILIEVAMNVGEVENYFDYSTEEGQNLLKEATANVIKGQVEGVVKKAQNEYRADIFGFGQEVERKYPKLWENMKNDWDNQFSEIETQLDVKVDIIGSALMSKPIKVEK